MSMSHLFTANLTCFKGASHYVQTEVGIWVLRYIGIWVLRYATSHGVCALQTFHVCSAHTPTWSMYVCICGPPAGLIRFISNKY